MKVLVLGVEHSRGKRKSDDSPYEICQLSYGTQVEPVSSDRRTVVGYGFREQTIGLSSSAVKEFATTQFPAELDLIVEPDPTNLRRNLCTGIKK